MLRLARHAAALCLALGLTVPAGATDAPAPLRVMTFNVRTTINVDDGREAWPKRRDLFIATIRAAHPDVMGTQELSQMQGDYIVARLPGYAWFGIDRQGGHKDEHMGVFYRRDRLDLVRQGNFWLSETPDVVASNTWHTPFPRMVTWGLFEDKASHRRFYLFDTHLFHRDKDERFRTMGVRVLLAQMAKIIGKSRLPVVLTGDFNTTPKSDSYKLLAQRLADIRTIAPDVQGPEGTDHHFTGVADRRLDWMFGRGFTPSSFATITDNRDGLYPSDHFPIFAVLEWGEPKGK